MKAVVEQELANLDATAKPFLMSKLVQALDSGETATKKNAENFLFVIASNQDAADRALIVKQLIDPKSSNVSNAEFFSTLVACDPKILTILEIGTKLRIRTLLQTNAETFNVLRPYLELRHPAHVLGACLAVLGESFMLSEMNEFTNLIVAKAPYSPEFITAVTGSPKIFASLFERYLAKASSSHFDTSNAFARAAPAMDEPLANVATDEQAFRLLAAIVRGAESGGNGPVRLAGAAFNAIPALRAKAKVYVVTDPNSATVILHDLNVVTDFANFISEYLA